MTVSREWPYRNGGSVQKRHRMERALERLLRDNPTSSDVERLCIKLKRPDIMAFVEEMYPSSDRSPLVQAALMSDESLSATWFLLENLRNDKTIRTNPRWVDIVHDEMVRRNLI